MSDDSPSVTQTLNADELLNIKYIQQELQSFVLDEKNKISKKATDFILGKFADVATIAATLHNDLNRVKGQNEGFMLANREIEKMHAKIDRLHSMNESLSHLADLTAGAYEELTGISKKVDVVESMSSKVNELTESSVKVNEKLSYQQVLQQPQVKESAVAPPQPKSYASIIKKQTVVQKQNYFEVITIKSKSECNDVKKLRANFLKTVDPIANKLKFDSIRMVFSNPQLIVRTTCKETVVFLIGDLTTNNAFEVNRIDLKNPKMIVRNIPKDIPLENLQTAIRNQNFPDMPNEAFKEEVKLVFKTGEKHRSTVDWVVETSPRIRSHILKSQSLYIDSQRCKVEDFFRLRRCFKCQGFGHSSARCRREDKCSHCSEQHRIEDCTNLALKPTCINCKLSKKAPHDHKASDSHCASRIAAIQREIQATDYSIRSGPLSFADED